MADLHLSDNTTELLLVITSGSYASFRKENNGRTITAVYTHGINRNIVLYQYLTVGIWWRG